MGRCRDTREVPVFGNFTMLRLNSQLMVCLVEGLSHAASVDFVEVADNFVWFLETGFAVYTNLY
jgi:hypothetical protein